ncbi:hypothetical protein Tco_0717003 [Tanacetum coccineum]
MQQAKMAELQRLTVASAQMVEYSPCNEEDIDAEIGTGRPSFDSTARCSREEANNQSQILFINLFCENSTNRDGSHSSHGNNQRDVQTVHPCFYADFMKCQPLNFKGTEGVVGLTRWIEKMESVFNISGCAIENQFVANETEKVDKYISGLPDNIYGNVKSVRPKTLDETIELANDLMDQKLRTYAERQTDNKRKADDASRNNHGHQQQPFKRQNVAKVYNMGSGEKKPYGQFARDEGVSGNTKTMLNSQKGEWANPKGNGFVVEIRSRRDRVDEKLCFEIPMGMKTLIFRGNESNNGRESRLTIISCSKAQEYMAKGTDNQEKNEKQSQNNKTGLGMEKTVKDKAKSKPESQSSQKVNRKVNWSKSKSTQVNPGAKVKEI